MKAHHKNRRKTALGTGERGMTGRKASGHKFRWCPSKRELQERTEQKTNDRIL